MTAAGVLLAVLALAMAAFIARHSTPVGAILLAVSALGVSAILFLPTALLGDWYGMDHVDRLYGLTSNTPLDPPEWIHLFAFTWLGLLIWIARRDLRNWRGAAMVTALGGAVELSQWLTDGREPRLDDAALNALGGLIGIAAAIGCVAFARWISSRRGPSQT